MQDISAKIGQKLTANSYDSALRILYITHYNSLGGGANLSLLNMMLDMRECYNVVPSVLIQGEGELSEKCRENGIEAFCTKFYGWQGASTFTSSLKSITKEAAKCILNKLYYFRKAQSLIHGHKFDIIHTNSSITQLGSVIASSLSVPHIWHIREYGLDDYSLRYVLPRFIVRKHYVSADRVIAISESICESYVNERRLCSADNIRVVYNGVRVPEPYAKTFAKDNRVNFCITGGIWPGKNQIMAVKACSALLKSTGNFTLHLIGHNSNDYADSIRDFISSLGMESHVKFWGFRTDTDNILRNMDVGLMLSKREAFGRVTVEYMMNYMPVIGVDTGATPEIIADGKTGFICPLDDSGRLAEIMLRFITHEELLSSMGYAGRERAVKEFSLERNTDNIYSLYQEVLL